MGSKAFDIIVFGATGFTGRFIAKYIHKQNADIKWAIAGRSQSKLSSLMTDLVHMQTPRNLPDVIIADATDSKSLADICGEARIVLNCTGPYRFLGKEVVEACLKAKCTYMDICGEPQFMEQCFLDYHHKALENNVLILHACAFDSVPADLGTLFTMRQYDELKCASIESFLTIDCPKGLKGHFTTYESAVHGMGDLKALQQIRKEIKKKYNLPAIKHPGPKLLRLTTYKFEERVGKYVIPFMAADASVVRSSQRTIAMRSGQVQWPQYSASVTLSDMYSVATASFYGSVFTALSGTGWGRSLLLSYPETFSDGVFSKIGPTKEQLDNTSFQMHFFAKGYDSADHVIEKNLENDERNKEEKEIVGGIEEKNAKKDRIILRGDPVLSRADVGCTQQLVKPCSVSRLWKNKKKKDNDERRREGEGEGGNERIEGNIEKERIINKYVHVVVKGEEPGYVATPSILYALAMCVLEERDILPKGGVLTPSSAFFNSPTIFSRLSKVGIDFEVISSSEKNVHVLHKGNEVVKNEINDETRNEIIGEGLIINDTNNNNNNNNSKNNNGDEERILKSEERDDKLDLGTLIESTNK